MSTELLALSSKLKQLPAGAGNTNMSLRQVLRVLRIANGDETMLRNTIRRTLMVDCLPNHVKNPISEVLCSISASETSSIGPSCHEITDSLSQIRYSSRSSFIYRSNRRFHLTHFPHIRIGKVVLNKKLDSHPALVPNVVFHEMPCHVKILQDMLTDWSFGENFLLLIGNQGVGKNKLADKLVQILNFEREYIQVCSHY